MEELKKSVKQRIVEISNKLEIHMKGKNDFAKYQYYKSEDIFRALNPLMLEHRLIGIFNMRKTDGESYLAELKIEDFDSDDNVTYYFEIAKADVKGANEAQKSGATHTYGKRYSYTNAFNLAEPDEVEKKQTAKNEPAKVSKTDLDKLYNAFKTKQVSKEQILVNLGKKESDITNVDIVNLRKIYAEIEKGTKKVEDVFNVSN